LLRSQIRASWAWTSVGQARLAQHRVLIGNLFGGVQGDFGTGLNQALLHAIRVLGRDLGNHVAHAPETEQILFAAMPAHN